jgi:hypothetical protein
MKDGRRQNQRQREESHRTDPPLIAIIAFQLVSISARSGLSGLRLSSRRPASPGGLSAFRHSQALADMLKAKPEGLSVLTRREAPC